MICQRCQNSPRPGWIRIAYLRAWIPCPDCGGDPQNAHCCDGLRKQPAECDEPDEVRS